MAWRGSPHTFSHPITCMQWPSLSSTLHSQTGNAATLQFQGRHLSLPSKSPGSEKPLGSVSEKSPPPYTFLPRTSIENSPSQLSPFPYRSMLPLFGLTCACVCVCVCVKSLQSCPTRPDPMDHQAPLSLEFSRQDYWSGLPFPSPGDFPNPGIESMSLKSPALAGGSLSLLAPRGKPLGLTYGSPQITFPKLQFCAVPE